MSLYESEKERNMLNLQKSIPPGTQKFIIVSHGFGSSLNSPTSQTALKVFPENGFATIAFDWPGHGKSDSYEDELSVSNCIKYISTVEKNIINENPNAEIFYFSSSFGAFINAIYICTQPHRGRKSFFRSGAVNMPELFKKIPKSKLRYLEKYGFVMLDEYTPPLKITSKFTEEMRKIDLIDLWTKSGYGYGTKFEMVHGEKDSTIDVAAAKKFATITSSKITVFPNGEHRLMDKGEPERVFALAVEFFKS